MILPFPRQPLQPTPRSADRERLVERIEWIFQEAAHQTQASADLGHPLRDHIEGRNGASSTRALKLPDSTGAAWYILTIFGIFGVVFLLQVASNILERTGKSLEDTYYSSVTPELNKKGLESNGPRCSALTTSSRAALPPSQPSLGPTLADSSPPGQAQATPWGPVGGSSESTCSLGGGVEPRVGVGERP